MEQLIPVALIAGIRSGHALDQGTEMRQHASETDEITTLEGFEVEFGAGISPITRIGAITHT